MNQEMEHPTERIAREYKECSIFEIDVLRKRTVELETELTLLREANFKLTVQWQKDMEDRMRTAAEMENKLKYHICPQCGYPNHPLECHEGSKE